MSVNIAATVDRNIANLTPSVVAVSKGQIISECPYEIIVWTKIPTKKLPRFLPKPLRRGQIKKFIKPIMLISIIRGYLT